MTLTAAYCHPGRIIAISDTLATVDPRERTAPGAFLIPTGPNLFSGKRRKISSRRDPVGLVQKMIIVHPNVLLMWVGNYDDAVRIITLIRFFIEDNDASYRSVVEFFNGFDRAELANVHVTILVADAQGCVVCSFGAEKEHPPEPLPQGGFLVANGSGRDIYIRAAANYQSSLRPESSIEEVICFAMNTIAALIAGEADSSEASDRSFGAAYEIAYQSPYGFEKLDGIMFVDVQAILDKPNEVIVPSKILHTHYKDSVLLISSIWPSPLPGDGGAVALYHAARPPGERGAFKDAHEDWKPAAVSFSITVVRGGRALGRVFLVRGTHPDGEPPVTVSHPFDSKSVRIKFHPETLTDIFAAADGFEE